MKDTANYQKVSVIIPTYNRSYQLLKAIKSVLNQTYPVFEILVCDDGSTDNSRSVVKKINDKRVKWFSGAHSGLPAVPRNRGLQRAVGKWIAFLDSDDCWSNDKIKKQLDVMRKYHVNAACSNGYRMSISGKKKGLIFSQPQRILSFNDLALNNEVLCSSVVLHSQLVKRIGPMSENAKMKSIEDYDYWLKISLFSDFIFLENPLISYTEDNPDTIRSIYSSRQVWKQRVVIWEDISKWSFAKKIGYCKLFEIFKNYMKANIKWNIDKWRQ